VYGKIILILTAWDRTGAKLSNIPLPILTKVLTNYCLLRLVCRGCATNQRCNCFRYLFHMLIEGHQGRIVCFLDFIAEAGGVGDQVS
jgi:hypothetical protein